MAAMERQAIIDGYRQKPELSVLIIGAGINGIGTFCDLALQGFDVLLVDKGDFCSGASAASTRMAHGGLRYLEHGEFRLVRESLVERNRLLRNAPHAVEPVAVTVPIFSWFSGVLNAPLKFLGLLKRPSERGALVIKLGLVLYDWLARQNRVMPTHRFSTRQQALQRYNKLTPKVIGVATYYDSLMPHAERIGVELVLDTESQTAQALNYVSVIGAAADTVTLQDQLSGVTFEVKPKLVINASGAWIDLVNRAMNHDTRFIGGTKGSHIVVDHPELSRMLDGHAIYFENTDGRLCIFLPFRDRVIIGATDIRIDHPEKAVCTEEEIDYMLGLTKLVLPTVTIDRSQIVFQFTGVRPLPNTKVEFEGLISRNHSILEIVPDKDISFPVYSLVGGKWTTYRALSEQVADKVLAYFKRTRKAGTADLPIGGGRDYPLVPAEREQWLSKVERTTGLARERLLTLFERYGTRAESVAEYIAAGPDKPLRHQPSYSLREIMFIAEHEKVSHVDDVILRRSLLGMLGRVDDDVLQQVAEAVGAVLAWTEDQIKREVERTTDILRMKHGIKHLHTGKQTAYSNNHVG
jgi:glycerol-3-phosphate dehydrogenase